jgi:aspartate carbamoyltransferase
MPTQQKNTLQKKFKSQDILSLDQFDTISLYHLFNHTKNLQDLTQKGKGLDILKGSLAALIFYEPSSRTFGSFSSAIKRLGGQTLEFQNPSSSSSVAKGETLEDTIRTLEAYSDIIILRHPEKGAAKKAAEAAFFVPIINAGDGVGEHPTQALLDMYTIYEKFGRLDNLTLLFAGDLLNGRTVHSLLRGLSLFKKNTIYLLSPQILKLPQEDRELFEKRGLTIHEIQDSRDIPKEADVWYWTRVQKERFKNLKDYERVKHSFIVTPNLMQEKASKSMILMHPLPRIGEIERSVDEDKRAIYFRSQIRNGMYVRMALISLVLGKLK